MNSSSIEMLEMSTLVTSVEENICFQMYLSNDQILFKK